MEMSSSPGGAVPVCEMDFITCSEAFELLQSCKDNFNMRILFLDIRPCQHYDNSHLCLDPRMAKTPVKRQMRVINVDVTKIKKPVLVKKMIEIMNPDDREVFKKRKDADHVIVMDDGKSKNNSISQDATQVIQALIKWDYTPDKILVRPQILVGGFPEWCVTYEHYTTNPTLNDIDRKPMMANNITKPPKEITTGTILAPIRPNVAVNNESNKDTQIELSTRDISPKEHIIPIQYELDRVPRTNTTIAVLPKQAPAVPPKPLSHQVPKPQLQPQQQIQQQPLSQLTLPSDRRHSLPRSNSSPNVAQDENIAPKDLSHPLPHLMNSNHHQHLMSQTKPKFNRAQKPNSKINHDLVRAYMAQIVFEPVVHGTVGLSITGLKNLGNTCFMNSVIQCLAYAPSIVSYFSNENYINHIDFHGQYGTKGELAIQFGSLVERLNAYQYRSLTPKSFRESIVRHIGFAGCEQQDSHEFMMMLFDKLHHDLNRHAHVAKQLQTLTIDGERQQQHNGNINMITNSTTDNMSACNEFWKTHTAQNKSLISEEFEGIFMSTLTCQACGNQSSTFELFNCLSLPITSTTRCTLQECLSHFSRTERIEAAWECSRCKQKREADKKIVICKLPKILIIHLKRFSQEGPWRQKLQTTVEFPLDDLTVEYTAVSPQVAYGQISPNNSKPSNRYDLYAVVNHYGSLDGGHYIACSKLNDKQQKWFKFDDNEVSEIKKTDLCIKSAYILFYSLNDSINMSQL